MSKQSDLEAIHASLVNGQRQQMVRQIDEYGTYDFWADYEDYLHTLYQPESVHTYFTGAVISYHRIKNR